MPQKVEPVPFDEDETEAIFTPAPRGKYVKFDPLEGGEPVKTSLTVPADLYRRFTEKRKAQGLSINAAMVGLIRAYTDGDS